MRSCISTSRYHATSLIGSTLASFRVSLFLKNSCDVYDMKIDAVLTLPTISHHVHDTGNNKTVFRFSHQILCLVENDTELCYHHSSCLLIMRILLSLVSCKVTEFSAKNKYFSGMCYQRVHFRI